jgi:hypothetical protein
MRMPETSAKRGVRTERRAVVVAARCKALESGLAEDPPPLLDAPGKDVWRLVRDVFENDCVPPCLRHAAQALDADDLIFEGNVLEHCHRGDEREWLMRLVILERRLVKLDMREALAIVCDEGALQIDPGRLKSRRREKLRPASSSRSYVKCSGALACCRERREELAVHSPLRRSEILAEPGRLARTTYVRKPIWIDAVVEIAKTALMYLPIVEHLRPGQPPHD